MANLAHVSRDFTSETIASAVQVGADWFRCTEGLDLTKEQHGAIVRDLVGRWDGVRDDDITRRSLTDDIRRRFQDLLDAQHMEQIGAVPLLDGKLHPIEDEL